MIRAVPPEGPRASPLVVVGRDPGAYEVERGRPFVGPAGHMLDSAMRANGLARHEWLITNVTGVRPPGDDWAWHRPEDIEEGLKSLDTLLRHAPRKLIVALGEQALHACLGLDPRSKKTYSVTDARGYCFDGPYGPVFAMLHPAFILYDWHPNYRLFTLDWVKAARYSREGVKHEGSAGFAATADPAAAFMELRSAPRLAVDIELDSAGAPTCVGFSGSVARGITFPLGGETTPYVASLLDLPTPKALHNAQFDMTMLRRAGLPVENAAWDTMLMWHALEPSLAGGATGKRDKRRTEKSLRFLASIFTDEPYWKDYDFETEEQRYILCAKDASVTLRLSYELERLLSCSR